MAGHDKIGECNKPLNSYCREEKCINRQDYIELVDCMYPNFFERENIRNLPEEWEGL